MEDLSEFSKSPTTSECVGEKGEVTRLLEAVRRGDEDAIEELVTLVYDELRQAAGRLLAREDSGCTLQPTALVHEAFLKMDSADVFHRAPNRRYLFSATVRAMRRLLVDVARRRKSAKRGGALRRVEFEAILDYFDQQDVDLEALDDAIDALSDVHDRASHVVTLRYLGGFRVDEVARQLEVSVSTVEADFRFARAWLRAHLREA